MQLGVRLLLAVLVGRAVFVLWSLLRCRLRPSSFYTWRGVHTRPTDKPGGSTEADETSGQADVSGPTAQHGPVHDEKLGSHNPAS